MPFKSEQQRKLCWVKYNQAKKSGKTPSWDCYEWSRETKQQDKSKSLKRYSKTKKVIVAGFKSRKSSSKVPSNRYLNGHAKRQSRRKSRKTSRKTKKASKKVSRKGKSKKL